MKKIIVTIALFTIGFVNFSQNSNTLQHIKYVTHAPDGSVALTIIDDATIDKMSVQSVDAFYKYQILDKNTSVSVYTSKNDGKDCIIDTTNLTEGTYDLRLYTSDFVITTDLEILRLGEFYAILKESQSLVVND